MKAGSYQVEYTLTKSLKKVYSIDSTSIRELRAEPTVVEALKEILPLDQIPGQYLGHTLQEVAELFPAAASADKLEKVQDVLEKIG